MALTTVQSGMMDSIAQYNSFKNRLINGAMVIDQRNAGASVTPIDNQYTLDRWGARLAQASKFTIQQNAGSVTPPTGFTKYLGVTVGAAANVTLAAGDYFGIQYRIEGFNFADIGMGTSSAKTVTVSFWARASITGTFGFSMFDGNATISYGGSYTITSANTWQFVTVTIPGTALGTWSTTNGVACYLTWSLGGGSSYTGGTANAWNSGVYYQQSGATNLITTNSASLYITGVQVEVGSTATAFDYRPYGTELQLCQRYYQQVGGNTGDLNSITLRSYNAASSYVANQYQFPVQMRTAPAMTISGTFAVTNCAQPVALGADGSTWSFQTQVTATGAAILYSNNSGKMTFSAEL